MIRRSNQVRDPVHKSNKMHGESLLRRHNVDEENPQDYEKIKDLEKKQGDVLVLTGKQEQRRQLSPR